jgi:signal transduction histidine kinase
MTGSLALCGWALAVPASLAALLARRELGRRAASIARACHELRGPITAARLGLELGERPGALSPARLRALDLELGRAALAIDDLAEIRAGRRPPGSWDDVGLHPLLNDSVEAWRSYASVRGCALRLSWSGAEVSVRGDRLRLAQACGNLIANSIEHGGGTVEVRVVAAASSDPAVRVEFSDDGPGLPAPVAELARRGRRSRGPHGHGLTVAAAVAAAHGGRLGAAPSERGARVVLELPVAAGALGHVTP